MNRDPNTMKVCIAGGRPQRCDVDLRGRDRYYDWRITYAATEPPPYGQTVEVEVRIVPGVVFAGTALVHGVEFRHDGGFLVDLVGHGDIRAIEADAPKERP